MNRKLNKVLIGATLMAGTMMPAKSMATPHVGENISPKIDNASPLKAQRNCNAFLITGFVCAAAFAGLFVFVIANGIYQNEKEYQKKLREQQGLLKSQKQH